MVKALVFGATGRQGGCVARSLLKDGHQVHALIRNPESDAAQALESQGAVLFKGNTNDIDSIKAAMVGTTAVFWPSMISFTDMDEEVRGTTNIIQAAGQSGTVNHLIYSTVEGVDKVFQVPSWDRNPFAGAYWRNKFDDEEKVRSAGFKYYTILRPTEFMTNFVLPTAAFQFSDLVKNGVWHSVWDPSFKNKLIDTEDIGKMVAAAIANPEKFNGRELELAGDRLAAKEVFDLVGAVAGKKLTMKTYREDEETRLCEENPLLSGQWVKREIANLDSDYGTRPLEDFGLGFKSFKEFLEQNKDLVIETYRNAE
ncbi:NAD(P)-binding protein [Xylariaceae sp. FL0662B]|nr:NAD(P)-binding protein [Xylariaceae sp. FL0662B]